MIIGCTSVNIIINGHQFELPCSSIEIDDTPDKLVVYREGRIAEFFDIQAWWIANAK